MQLFKQKYTLYLLYYLEIVYSCSFSYRGVPPEIFYSNCSLNISLRHEKLFKHKFAFGNALDEGEEKRGQWPDDKMVL